VFGWHFDYAYAHLDRFVGEGLAEESVGYPIRLPSTLATHLSLASSELVEPLDGDGCVMLHSKIGQLFGE
jgi:hypothetical protein